MKKKETITKEILTTDDDDDYDIDSHLYWEWLVLLFCSCVFRSCDDTFREMIDYSNAIWW